MIQSDALSVLSPHVLVCSFVFVLFCILGRLLVWTKVFKPREMQIYFHTRAWRKRSPYGYVGLAIAWMKGQAARVIGTENGLNPHII